MQLPGGGWERVRLCPCAVMSRVWKGTRRIIQTPSLETPDTEIIFYLCKWKFLTGIEMYPPPSECTSCWPRLQGCIIMFDMSI